MITLPDDTVQPADERSPGRFLAWVARRQWRTLAIGAFYGIVWICSQAAIPAALGYTIDRGLIAKDENRLLLGCLVITGLGLLTALSGVFRHRTAVSNWMQAALRTDQVVGHHVSNHGPAVSARTTTGEIVSVTGSDCPRVGDLFDMVARLVGALVGSALVVVLLARIDLWLGVWVLIGVPALTIALSVLVRPLARREHAHRALEGELTALGADTVAGLRVLRGIGGERQFAARYATRSQQVRGAGVNVAGIQALLDAAHVLLPGIFVVGLTWLAVDRALTGALSPGQVVTVFGYAAFLRLVMETFTEGISKVVRGRIAAQRILAVLALREPADIERTAPLPPAFVPLHDPTSGLTLAPHRMTGLVADDPDDAAVIADRFGRLNRDGEAPRLGGTPVDQLRLDDVRARIFVSEAEPRLFSGTLREALDPHGGARPDSSRSDGRSDSRSGSGSGGRSGSRSDGELLTALSVADALEVLEIDPAGLDSTVEERGRGYSGGQRQRLALARAVLADPEILVLVEPTSAVDAHTEDRIAGRLAAARSGRTTLITTSSPLMLERCDVVVRLAAGRVRSTGTHAELLATDRAYRALVVREENDANDTAGDGTTDEATDAATDEANDAANDAATDEAQAGTRPRARAGATDAPEGGTR